MICKMALIYGMVRWSDPLLWSGWLSSTSTYQHINHTSNKHKKIVYGEDAFVNKSHLMLRKKEYNLKRNIYTK